MENLSTRQKYIIGGSLAFIVIISYLLLQYKMKSDIIVASQPPQPVQAVEENKDVQKSVPVPKEIVVHVSGKVKSPGVIRLTEGARVVDAIEKVGGTLKDADLDKLNLASVIADGQKIYVPKFGEAVETTSSSSSTSSEGSVININSASVSELDKIPGVGPSTAQKILDYRKSKGSFRKVDEIKNVSGIGEKKFEKIKKYITI